MIVALTATRSCEGFEKAALSVRGPNLGTSKLLEGLWHMLVSKKTLWIVKFTLVCSMTCGREDIAGGDGKWPI